MAKKMTIKKWLSLSESTRKRALTAAFPNQGSLVEMMLKEIPDLNNGLWRIALTLIKDADDAHYKTYVNRTYYM